MLPPVDRVALVVCACVAGVAPFAASCATADDKHRLGSPDRATVIRLAAAERAYRERSPDYPAMRDELVADPVAAGWLTRLFVRDLFTVREGRPLGEDQELLRAAAKIENPTEKRAIEQITALGAAAVPVLVGDLLLHRQPQPRELGIELLGYVGTPALPRLLEVAGSGDPHHRRAAARALAHFADQPAALQKLRALSDDPEFMVRADAVRALRYAPGDAVELLYATVVRDEDPFVRRVAAASLVGHPGRRTAFALVDYLERCKRELDTRGYETAQETLQELAATRNPRTVQAWRHWAENQPQTP